MRPHISIRGCVRPFFCWSIRPLVYLSVGPSIHWSVHPLVRPECFRAKAFFAVSRALLPLPNRTQLLAVYPALFF